MQNRRKFLLVLTAGVAAMGFVVASVLADELFGTLTKVDVDGKKITVTEKDSDKEHVFTVTDDTEVVKGKNAGKIDLEKLEKSLKKAQDAGKAGITVTVTHEKKRASKLVFKGKGKGKKADN
jgi:hypothetical protein